MTENSLAKLYEEHTGKVSDKWESYLSIYEKLFQDYKEKSIRLLEIGVQNGGSLEIWSKFFSNAIQIIGIDINPNISKLTFEDKRIEVKVIDASDCSLIQQELNIEKDFDIIIDDGSHISSEIIKSFLIFFPHVANNGVYIVEDIHTSYMNSYGGGLFEENTAIGFFQRICDIVNQEHWACELELNYKPIKYYLDRYNIDCHSIKWLESIHSISFLNSLVIITKKESKHNKLGRQIISGINEIIEKDRLILNNKFYNKESFSNVNINFTINEAPEVLLPKLKSELDELRSLKMVINDMLNSRSWKITYPFRKIAQYGLIKTIIKRLKNIQISYKKLFCFNETYYLISNPDVKADGVDPYIHYLTHGVKEGRSGTLLIHINKLFIQKIKLFYRVIYELFQYKAGRISLIKKIISIAKERGISGLLNEISSRFNQKSIIDNYADYKRYIELHEPKLSDLKTQVVSAKEFKYRPLFSILVPVYNVKSNYLRQFLDSVINQTYSDWELCIADDSSTDPQVKKILEQYQQKDNRIKVKYRSRNGHISEATNTALDLAEGEYICLMDNDDVISPNALYEFAKIMQDEFNVDMIYSDEDKIDENNNRYEPFFKPDWSPEAIEACMFTAHFACYKTKIAKKINGFRVGYEGAQDYDFVLRFTEIAEKIIHIPKVLYHWRAIAGSTALSMESKNYVLDAAIKSLQDRVKRVAGGGTVKNGRYPGCFDVRRQIKDISLISIIIPTAGKYAKIGTRKVDLISNVLRSINESSTYKNIEVIVVHNGNLSINSLQNLNKYNCKLIKFSGEFNIAKKMNIGAKEAQGEYLLFLNDDIEVIKKDWIECMLQFAQRPGVGGVGAKLLFENNTLQHVGVTFSSGLPDHIRRGYPRFDPGYFFSSVSNRNYLAVTGAVFMTNKKIFRSLGGFDVRLAVNYNDIDFCLRIIEAGYRIVYAAGAELYHYESISRSRVVDKKEIDLFLMKWGDFVKKDPFYSENFRTRPPNYNFS